MPDHNKPERITPDPGLVAREIPQGAAVIGESPDHESSEVQLRPIITTIVAMLMIIVVSDVFLLVLWKFWSAREAAADRAESPLQAIRPQMDDPKLQVDEPAALALHTSEGRAPIDGYKWVEPNKVASIPVEEAMKRIAAAGALPSGPEWSLAPGEQMVGGVIMNGDQVKYANTPPSQAQVGTPGAAPAPGQVGTVGEPGVAPRPATT